MIKYASRTFQSLNLPSLSYTEEQITEAVEIFYNLSMLKMGHLKLNGFSKEVLPNLEKALVASKGEVGTPGPVQVLLNSVDGFLKRVLVATGTSVNSCIDSELMTNFIQSHICPSFNNNPSISKQDPELYRTNPEGLYIFARVRDDRNDIHYNIDWLSVEVLERLQYLVTFYVWVVLCFRDRLITAYPDLLHSRESVNDETTLKESRLLYDYVKFGRSANEIKNRIVRTFITHTLYDKNEMSITELVALVCENLSVTYTEKSMRSFLDKMKGLVELDGARKRVNLTEQERHHQDKAKRDFERNHLHFKKSVVEILDTYGLKTEADKVITYMTKLYADNSSIAANEFDDKVSDQYPEDVIETFKDNLESLGIPEDKIPEVAENLLMLCKGNGYVVNIGVGKAFSKMANIELSNSYAEREVFLDTQIVLALLCLNEDFEQLDTSLFRTALAFSEKIISHPRLHFKYAVHYLPEAIGHLRNALYMQEMLDSPRFRGLMSSTNVFYQHFFYLRQENKLPDGIASFADYLEYQFELYTSDLTNKYLEKKLNILVTNKLKQLGVEIDDGAPNFSQEDLDVHQDIFFDEKSNDIYSGRNDAAIKKDAIMGAYLTLIKDSEPIAPFLVTNDNSFKGYRKNYMRQVDSKGTTCWLLFTPGMLVNHLDLLNLKIKEGVLTDDLLTMIKSESDGKSYKLVDIINRVLHLNGLSQRSRDILQRSMLELDDDNSAVEITDPIPLFARNFQHIYDYFKVSSTSESRISILFEEEEDTCWFIDALREVDEDSLEKLIKDVNVRITTIEEKKKVETIILQD